MNILVLDVAAKETGALTVLEQYYHALSKDKKNHYFFCVSIDNLKDLNNISILKYPWVAKSWIHRCFFELFIANCLVKKYSIDKVISLQNLTIFRCKCIQELYVHQPIPFTEIRFNILKDLKLWIYQNVYSLIVYKSIKKAKKIIVQTKWMKKAIIKKCNISEKKIIIVHPKLNIKITDHFSYNNWKKTFIYPATMLSYKNHIVIFKAAKRLIEDNNKDFTINLTITENQLSKECKKIYQEVSECIILCGNMQKKELFKHYCSDMLIFPSYVETFGLPLMEAKSFKNHIICANTEFAKEILENYNNYEMFEYNDDYALSLIIRKELEKKNREF